MSLKPTTKPTPDEVELNAAIERMKAYALGSQKSFSRNLQIKAPQQMQGCLAGPSRIQKRNS
ncbi:hypothetical protein [Shewanella maritima]|uniref:hypothetical protein n=1 Tax=Shewanella maritima TaxID=2520507 RepID=UPI0013EE5779|nr:hypothetical protein [Shewanella maritima]